MKKIDNKSMKSNNSHIEGLLSYKRTPIEIESPEQFGYENIKYNLTESSVPDMILGELGNLYLKDLVLCYGNHIGNPHLRQRIANKKEIITQDHVLVTAGAAAALFIIATSLLKPRDHMVVLHPNYVTNIETPRAIGCRVDYLPLSFDAQFQLDLAKLEQLIQPNTRLISLTYPHNPTGAMLRKSELTKIISLIEAKGCYLLIDETYRDMTYSEPLPMAADLSPKAISVSSFSKSYGLPGIRIGWLITQNNSLMETFLAAKEQIFICNSVVDEKIADHFLAKKEQFFPKIQAHIQTNFATIKVWIENNDYIEWVEPRGGCVCFPRIKPSIKIDINKFYRILNETYKTFVGPGHWFEVDRRYMRIGYGWPNKQELEGGLNCITKAIEETIAT
ncbi:MAG: aminotransferase class I/II-fold pyridoxal phosphate-dependent enzyme [Candidatus Heimdallarchaeota archaeon]